MPEGSENLMPEIGISQTTPVESGMPATPDIAEGTKTLEKMEDFERRLAALEAKVSGMTEKTTESTSSVIMPSLASERVPAVGQEASVLPSLGETSVNSEDDHDRNTEGASTDTALPSLSVENTSTTETTEHDSGEAATPVADASTPAENETPVAEHEGVPDAAAKAEKGKSDFSRKFGTENSPSPVITASTEGEGDQNSTENHESNTAAMTTSEGQGTDGPPPVDGIGISEPAHMDAASGDMNAAHSEESDGQSPALETETPITPSADATEPIVPGDSPKEDVQKENTPSNDRGWFGWLRGGKSNAAASSETPTPDNSGSTGDTTTGEMTAVATGTDTPAPSENGDNATMPAVETGEMPNNSSDIHEAEHPTDAEEHPQAA